MFFSCEGGGGVVAAGICRIFVFWHLQTKKTSEQKINFHLRDDFSIFFSAATLGDISISFIQVKHSSPDFFLIRHALNCRWFVLELPERQWRNGSDTRMSPKGPGFDNYVIQSNI